MSETASTGKQTDSLSGQMKKMRIATQIQQEAENMLRTEGAAPLPPIVAEKGTRTEEGDVQLSTNVYGILMKQISIYQYDVRVSAVLQQQDGPPKKVDLTKKDKSDAIVIDRRAICRDMFALIKEREKEFFAPSGAVYYDLQSIVYALAQLDVPVGHVGKIFILTGTEIPKGWENFSTCEVEIRRVSEGNEMKLGDFAKISRDLTQMDHSVAQFLDIATSQHVMFAKDDHITFSASSSFLLQPTLKGFSQADEAGFADNGSYLGIGAQKSVRFVEGPLKVRGTNAALIVETKKTPFHIVESVLDKSKRLIRDIHNLRDGDFAKIDKILTGLQVETSHLGYLHRFMVKGLDMESARQKEINVDGKNMSVEQYFKDKYNYTLSEPTLPLIKARGKNEFKSSYFPMELCYVADNQRVKTNQQTPKQVQEMIKKCAIPPLNLKSQNDLTFESLNLKENDFLKNAQIRVVDHPLSINGRTLPPPELEFGKRFITRVNQTNFTWQGKEFLIPSVCTKWEAHAFLAPRERLMEKDFGVFLNRFVSEANHRGMQMPPVSKFELLHSDSKTLKAKIQQAAENGCDFFLAIHPDAADDLHCDVKLYESNFSIVTQAIRYGTLMNMIQRGQPQTIMNIVNKTNVKLGGLNYSLSVNSLDALETLGKETLYIGFGMNHPGGGLGMGDEVEEASTAGKGQEKTAAPSIIGYSANVGLKHPFEFIGDFICQQPLRDEKIGVIRTIIDRCLQKYRENRKADPQRIILYRNGCGEGQFLSILKYELALIKLALQKAKCSAPVTMLISNKMQNIRFFYKEIDSRARPADQNIKPGTVVDHSVTHPIFSEFFLNSHRALQGTSRTPKYTVLVNENNLSLEQMERITYQLCYGHQIVNLPTSLPSPVYIANRYAERGRKLYQRWINHARTDDGTQNDYRLMTETLGYFGNRILGDRRINA
ncbi:piwi domain-containing protein [Ditylenchus destructor]|nr:piwi domain-containing protein [Ditylenchus destructor]